MLCYQRIVSQFISVAIKSIVFGKIINSHKTAIVEKAKGSPSPAQQMMKRIIRTNLPNIKHNIYEVHTISFQTFFFVWVILLILHTWNSSPLRSNLFRLQCNCFTVRASARPHGSPLVWACQWPSSQPLSPPQLCHNDSLWA